MKWISLLSKKRLKIVIYAFVLYSVAIVMRLIYVQIIDNERLTDLAKKNWDREIPFVTERGNITDRHDEVIVTNKLAPTLYFIPKQSDNIALAAQQLAPILETDEKKLFEKMQKSVYLVKIAPEGKNISEKQVTAIQALNIKGLYSGVDYIRHYPYGSLLARFLGFTGYDNQGLAGIEYEYNEQLTGNEAAIRLFTDAKNMEMAHVDDEWKDGKSGATVQLTIDLAIQQVVERELSQAMQRYDADQAIGLAMNPRTGEILALASYPTYNPQHFEKVDSTIYNRNLPVFMTYEPGSTFKIITLSAAIEEGVVDLARDNFYDPGFKMVEGARLRCWKREGHKDETFLEVVENSCNPGFIELGQRVGAKKLLGYIKDFGFGQKTGSNIAGEASGILFSEKNFGPVEHATTSFGQGISVTPIQQMQAVAAAVNGGTLYTPYVVSRIIDEDGKVIVEEKPEAKRQVISEETSKKVREALESVVAKGSGKQAFREGLRIGGKTGTAQKVENGRYKDGDYIVSFIGFAPADNPEIIVYVAVDNPKNHLQFGGLIAAPIVGQIIEDVAPIIGIEKSAQQIEKKTTWLDPVMVEVDNFVGLTVDEVVQQHHPLKIEWHGEGTIVSQQLPAPGSKIEQQSTIHLYLKNNNED